MSAAPDPFVRVVVLNWNSAWYTGRCLRALAATEYSPDRFEVVVVDNGSIDGSLEQLRFAFPGLTILENGRNLGFAEGCNRAMRDRAGVDHIALVNNDAAVEPGWLRALVDALEADPGAGAASALLVLEPRFVAVDVEANGPVEFRAAAVDGLDVTGGVRPEGFRAVPALDWPLDRTFRLDRGVARLWVPVGPAAREVEVGLAGTGRATARIGARDAVAGDGPGSLLCRIGPADHQQLVNGLGTGLTDQSEGYDLHYGEVDDGRLGGGEVDGFCGGGALLRAAMIDQVGLFDPSFFAYYEDTDLSWRARRAGWRILAVPGSVIHHAFGASAGSRAHGFYFLDRRNWWLTAERNGTPAQRREVRAVVRRSFGRAFRANVFGRLRRGRPPHLELVGMWARVVAAVAAALPRQRRESGRPVGQRPTDRVRSRLQPPPVPRPPRVRPGGPLLVYVDVTDTLRSGWRAGIQRVVCALVAHLPLDGRVELVPIVHVAQLGRFRRVTSSEYARLLAPAGPPPPPGPTGPAHAARRRAMAVADRVGVGSALREARHRSAGGSDPVGHLLLDRLEPGSVFLDLDAVWNCDDVDRSVLLADLRARGVRIVPFVHDLLPLEHPEWFVPELRGSFARSVRAQLTSADLVLTNSRSTAAGVEALAERLGRPDLPVRSVSLGGDPVAVGAAVSESALPDRLDGTRYLLVVGTIEPRKNQACVLEAFEQVRAEVPDVHLVVVGRAGWDAGPVVDRLEDTAADPRIHWFPSVPDGALDALYRHAFLVLVPSVSEGYGLPVAEALAHGVPVVSSPGGALAEFGAAVAAFVAPSEPEEWAQVVVRHLADPVLHARAVEGARAYRAPTWAGTAAEVVGLLVPAGPVPAVTEGDGAVPGRA